MNYEEEILKVLYESGSEGLSVRKISLHVYNSAHSLFDSPSFEEVRKNVVAILKHHSGKKSSLISRMSVRGHYCINLESRTFQQQRLNFSDKEVEESPVKPSSCPDTSLSLFDF